MGPRGFQPAAEFSVRDQAWRHELRFGETGAGVRVTHENGCLARLTPEEFSASARSSSIVHTSGRKPLQIFRRDRHRSVTWFRCENQEELEADLGHLRSESSVKFLSLLHGFALDGKGERDFCASIRITDALKRGGVQRLPAPRAGEAEVGT